MDRGARIQKSDRTNQQAVAYLVYVTIIWPENICHYPFSFPEFFVVPGSELLQCYKVFNL
jgi:hypothetical protein